MLRQRIVIDISTTGRPRSAGSYRRVGSAQADAGGRAHDDHPGGVVKPGIRDDSPATLWRGQAGGW